MTKTNSSLKIALVALALVALPLLAADLTITGRVLSIGPDTIVLSTPSGQKTYMLNTSTIRPADLAVDHNVVITYVDEKGSFRATNIAVAPAATAQTSPPAGALTNERDDVVVGDGEDDNVTGLDQDAARDGVDPGQSAAVPADTSADALPATASNLPLAALAGALALGGALALRKS